MSAPTGNLNSGNLSINQLIAQQTAKVTIAQKDLPVEPFHKDDVIRNWKSTAHAQKLEGQDQIYHVMIKRDPVQLDETTFLFEVDNAIQLTRLENGMNDILARIRKEIRNYDLTITIEISNEAPDEDKFMTGNDRFEKMARKNSNLFDLKSRFNLDIDY
ncbi:MAG: hypothetical protein KA734_06650 [Fluviicola sp.]|nr:hypothetical protein [Fluviicola sp.]MBP6271548.1 hypothetical protein [Fluviicola sp.]